MRTASLLILGALLTAPVAAQDAPPADQPAGLTAGELMESISIRRTTPVRVNDGVVIGAREVHLARTGQAGSDKLSIYVVVDRVELDKLRKPNFGVELDNVQMLSLDPGLPITVMAVAKPEFQEHLRARFAVGKHLDALVGETGPEGFPMLLDLENYAFEAWAQQAGPPRFAEETP